MIDKLAAKATNDKQNYVKDMIDLCYALMPKKAHASSGLQSVTLLIVYRIIFNRTYELYSSLFAPKEDPMVKKISALMKRFVKYFSLPMGLM
jgi:hypothetical protein